MRKIFESIYQKSYQDIFLIAFFQNSKREDWFISLLLVLFHIEMGKDGLANYICKKSKPHFGFGCFLCFPSESLSTRSGTILCALAFSLELTVMLLDTHSSTHATSGVQTACPPMIVQPWNKLINHFLRVSKDSHLMTYEIPTFSNENKYLLFTLS